MQSGLDFTFKQFRRKFGNRFPARYDFEESIEMLPGDPPVEFSFVGIDGFNYLAIISEGAKVKLYKMITSYDKVESGPKKRIEKMLNNKSLFSYGELEEFQKYGIFDYYEGSEGSGSFKFVYSTREESLQGIVGGNGPANPSTTVYTPATVIQKYVDEKQVTLPGETKVRPTSTELAAQKARKDTLDKFDKVKLAEFVCLIVLEPGSGLPHVFIYWTGTRDLDPNDLNQNFYRDRIAYYVVDLGDQKYKADHPEVYNDLEKGLVGGGNNSGLDPIGKNYRKAFFDLQPVNPPGDTGTYTPDQLKQMPIEDNSLVGWFLNREIDQVAGKEYYDDQGKITKKYSIRKYAGNFKVGYERFLFSDKIRPPQEILTTFISGQSAIPEGLAPDTDKDAMEVKFTMAKFKSDVGYLLRYMKAFPDRVKIKITGHTDSSDNADKNYELSRKRAYSFYKYLQTATDLGVNPLTKQEAETQIGPDVTFNPKKDMGDYVVGKGEELCFAALGDDQKNPLYRKITIEYVGVRP